MSQTSARTLASSLDKLKISRPGNTSSKAKKAEPVNSWEEEAEDDHTEDESDATTPVRPVSSSDYPGPPPPTPSSPSFMTGRNPYQAFSPSGMDGAFEAKEWSRDNSPSQRDGEQRRPEKTTAVASRMIAAGIGQKAPRRTKEEREYDQAMKVQEKKKRHQAKADEEKKKRDKERAKKAMWDS